MGSIFIYPGMKIERTPEDLAEIEALRNMKDEDIDLSDIPEITDEEWKRFYRENPSTPEEWEQFYRWNPKVNPELRRKLEAKKFPSVEI